MLTKVIAENPKYPIAKRRLADLYLLQRDYGKATEMADQILKDSPNDPDGQLIKGRILLEQKKITEAITAAAEAGESPTAVAASAGFSSGWRICRPRICNAPKRNLPLQSRMTARSFRPIFRWQS